MDGKVEGLYRGYFESGKIQAEKMFMGGTANGPCNLYHENGKIKIESVFESDNQVSIIEYDEKGNKKG
jgi:antitoxin component YwqK of YwqJK toxin-antitoxin module